MAMSSNDADPLASWGGGQDLSAWEALMWRTGGDYRTRSTGVMIELLDTEPDWDRLVAAHDRLTQRVPRLRERVVEPAPVPGCAGLVSRPAFRSGVPPATGAAAW